MFRLDSDKIATMSVHDAPESSPMIVTKETFQLSGGMTLESGAYLPEVEVAYERYGELSADRTNVVLIAHGITPSSVELRDGSVLFVYYTEGVGSVIRAARYGVSRTGLKPLPWR
jgi:homoserine acetyltransferase